MTAARMSLLALIFWPWTHSVLADGIAQVDSSCFLRPISFVTEHSPPFNYLENNQVVGTAVDIVLALAERAGCPIARKDISIQPWARSYRTALDGPNIAIFSITRTPERESLLKWVGPIGMGSYNLIGKKAHHFNLMTANHRGQYLYGAVRNDIGVTYLEQVGVPTKAITLAVTGISVAKMLQADRIDLWAYSETGAFDSLRAIGASPADYQTVYTLAVNEFYLAFSLDVADSTIERLQAALVGLPLAN